MKRIVPKPGYEFRGFKIKLYPTKDQIDWLYDQSNKLRIAWNWLVNLGHTEKLANISYLSKLVNNNGNMLLDPRPSMPSYDGLSPEASHKLADKYHSECSTWYKNLEILRKKEIVCAYRNFHKEVVPAFEYKHDYQLLQRVIWWKLYPNETDLSFRQAHDKGLLVNSNILQAMCKDFFSKNNNNKQRPKKFRKLYELMPIRTGSKHCFETGDFGGRGKKSDFYNCQITIGGGALGIKIRGRLPGINPGGHAERDGWSPFRVLEGVAIVKEADGWYAAIKVERLIRKLDAPVSGSSIGIDVGLDNIAAFSDGRLIVNIRNNKFSNKIAQLQQRYEDTKDSNLKNMMSRLHQKTKRHIMHILYNEVIKPLSNIETIKVEKLSAKIGFIAGSRKISTMRLVTSLLKERYKDRVREVRCEYTSQGCSQCGRCDKRTADAWSYDHGPFGECPYCGYTEHRDINAARNIEASNMLSLDN